MKGLVVLGTLFFRIPSQTMGKAKGKAIRKADSLGLICLTWPDDSDDIAQMIRPTLLG